MVGWSGAGCVGVDQNVPSVGGGLKERKKVLYVGTNEEAGFASLAHTQTHIPFVYLLVVFAHRFALVAQYPPYFFSCGCFTCLIPPFISFIPCLYLDHILYY